MLRKYSQTFFFVIQNSDWGKRFPVPMFFGQEFVSWSWLTLMGLAWFPHFLVGWLMAANDLPAIWQKERTSENLTCMTCIWPAALSHLISLASLLSFTVGCCAYQLLVLAPVTSSVLAPHLRSCWVHTLSFSELLGRRQSYGGVFFWRRDGAVVFLVVLFPCSPCSLVSEVRRMEKVEVRSDERRIQPADAKRLLILEVFGWRNPWRLRQAAVVPCPCRARPL